MNYVTRRLLRIGIGLVIGFVFVIIYHAITGKVPSILK